MFEIFREFMVDLAASNMFWQVMLIFWWSVHGFLNMLVIAGIFELNDREKGLWILPVLTYCILQFPTCASFFFRLTDFKLVCWCLETGIKAAFIVAIITFLIWFADKVYQYCHKPKEYARFLTHLSPWKRVCIFFAFIHYGKFPKICRSGRRVYAKFED